jgi:hypothetical protein
MEHSLTDGCMTILLHPDGIMSHIHYFFITSNSTPKGSWCRMVMVMMIVVVMM